MGNQPTTLIDPASTSHKAQPVSNTNKSLDGFVKRLSLGKKLSISRSKKKKANYFLPPNAGNFSECFLIVIVVVNYLITVRTSVITVTSRSVPRSRSIFHFVRKFIY